MMEAIKVKKDELISKLKKNRENHSKQFEEAAEGYREKVIEQLEIRIKEARSGKLPNLYFALPLPVDQTKAYDRVIGMLEMSIDEEITLSEENYQQYVLDDWAWSANATISNTMYLKAK